MYYIARGRTSSSGEDGIIGFMKRFKEGDRIILEVGKPGFDMDSRRARQIMSGLNTLGIRILTDNETELNTLNIEQFAAKSPIVSRSSYLGMEHFRSLNGLTGLNLTISSRLFSRLVDPYGELASGDTEASVTHALEATTKIQDFYETHDINVVSRSAAGLPEIPLNLQRPEIDRVDELAIKADSVLEIAKHRDEYAALVAGVGQRALQALDTVNDHILRSIKQYRTAQSQEA